MTNDSDGRSESFDRSWHLGRTPREVDVAEFEYAIMRAFEAFGRWQAECHAVVADFSLSGPENALLHIIRTDDRPKTVRDLAALTNRDDVPNIQYSLRKLVSGGLVERTGSGRTGVYYTVTELGRRVTDRYADVREALLIEAVDDVPELSTRLREATRTLDLMIGIYAQSARAALTHRHPAERIPLPPPP